MKKNRLLFLLLSLFMICVGARAEEVEIGSLDGAGNNSYLPMNSLYEYSYTQQIYTADEIGTAGTINSITVWLYGNANLYEMPFDIYMVQTEKDAFDSTTDWIPVTAKDIVYSGSVKVNHTDAQAYTFELSTPFDYDGSSNLVICFNNTTGQWKSGLYGKVFGADTDPKRALYVRQDGTAYDPTDMSGITANGHTYFRNVITLDIEGESGSCAKPTSLTADEITARSVTLNWEGESDTYHLEYKKQAEEEWHSLLTGNSSSYTVNGLEPETAYQARVQAVCDAENSSKWKTVSFTTLVSCYPIEGAYNPTMGVTTMTVTFEPGDEEQDAWQIGYCTSSEIDMNNLEDFSMYHIVDVNTTTAEIDGLEPNTSYALILRANCGGGDFSKWIGPFGWYTTEKVYPEPTNVTVSNIAAKSADISWTKGRDESSWNLRYRPVVPAIIEGGIVTDFEDGTLGDWTAVVNGEGDGFFATDMTQALQGNYPAHSGTYACMVRSWAGSAQSADNWLISPQVELGGTLSFWVCDDGQYHEHFEIAVSTTGTDPADFTVVKVPSSPTNSWSQVTVDLSAYAGQTGYIAIHHEDYDQDFLLIDDIQYIPAGATVIEEPWIEENVTATKFSITGLTPETEYEAQVQGVFGSGEDEVSEWSELVKFTTLDITPVDVAVTPAATTAELTWNGSSCSYDVRYGTLDPDAPVSEAWQMYDNGTMASAAGLGGTNFSWAVMFPAGTFNSITKASVFDYSAMTGVVSIYNDGATAPEGEALGEADLTLTGSNDFVEVEFSKPITLDASKNVWVVVTTSSYSSYPAAYCDDTSNPNGRWVELNGSWHDVQSVGISDAGSWMVRAFGESTDPNAILWSDIVSTSETSYQIEGLDPETYYLVEVRTNCEEDDEISDWVRTSFTTLEAEAPITDLVAENITKTSADIEWTVNGAEEEWNLRYRKPYGKIWGFENGLGDWTVLDADGDGYTWSAEVPYDAHSGSGLIASASYINNVGALNPDNWLISPEVELGGTFSFYAKGQDASYYAEKFGVFVSTTGTDADDFTQVGADVTTTGEWTLYTFDLKDYSGNGHIAIRHYDVTDMFWLDVDDINYIAPSDVEEEWTVVEGITEHPYTIEDLEEGTEYEAQVQSVYGDTTSEWSESVYFTTPTELIVLDNDSEQEEGQKNTDLLAENMGKNVNFTISGRTLYKDGSWNTIALPFNLTAEEIENSPLAGATIKTVDPESMVEGTHVTLDMMDYAEHSVEALGRDEPMMVCGWPYFVKWEDGDDIVDPTFNGVTIAEASDGMMYVNYDYSIIGVYTYSSLPLTPASELADDELQIYYMGADNKLKFTAKPRLLNAFRSGFCFISSDASGALDFTINWGDDTTTGIVEIEGADSKATSAPTGIYNLQGVKLNQLPKQKGVYINNGKKVIIK